MYMSAMTKGLGGALGAVRGTVKYSCKLLDTDLYYMVCKTTASDAQVSYALYQSVTASIDTLLYVCMCVCVCVQL